MGKRGKFVPRKYRNANTNTNNTIKVGDFVTLDTSGNVKVAANSGAALVAATTPPVIIGIARTAVGADVAVNTVDVEVDVFTDSSALFLPMMNTNYNAVSAWTQLDAQYGLFNDNTYGWMLNNDLTTNGCFTILEFAADETVGYGNATANTAFPGVWVKPNLYAVNSGNVIVVAGRMNL